jgi:hypothetical protein
MKRRILFDLSDEIAECQSFDPVILEEAVDR